MASESLWLPSTYTKPLRPDFQSDGPKLRAFIERFYRSTDNPNEPFRFLDWQAWLLDHLLERRDDGSLRYRTAIIYMGRQNGKTVIGQALGIYGLLFHCDGPTVVGIAEQVKQAQLIYDQVAYVVHNTALRRRFKATRTRGIKSLDGTASYSTYPKKEGALQGIPISLGLVDEIHLVGPESWAAIQAGTLARPEALQVGFSTAGDDSSDLMKDLLGKGRRAAAGEAGQERFGAFIWEGIEGAGVHDEASISRANPSVACGFRSMSDTHEVISGLSEAESLRYVHNLFQASDGQWMPQHVWAGVKGDGIPDDLPPTVIAVDKDGDWKYATIIEARKINGVIHTNHMKTIKGPSLDSLVDECLALKVHGVTFVMHAYSMKTLAERLQKRGCTVKTFTGAEMNEAASTGYAKVMRREVQANDGGVVARQLPYTIRKNVGAGYKLLPAPGEHIEAVYAQFMAIYGAETIKERGLGIG